MGGGAGMRMGQGLHEEGGRGGGSLGPRLPIGHSYTTHTGTHRAVLTGEDGRC